ncbi:MAG TPA: HAD-IIA family hydrolase [Solirubrobacterales bacterium]|nr:HAD-IIA family hydrolase [Solirubrobacterales bacterium]
MAERFDGLLVDLDGVVWVGREMVPGAVEALQTMLGSGMEVVFVTNNSVRQPAAYATRLREAGIEVGDDRVVTAGAVTARLAAERVGAGGTAFVIGAPGFKETVAAAGLALLNGEAARGANAVIVSGHREFDYAELLTATFALRAGASLFGTSRDPTLPMPGGAWPGTGATLAAVETASGKTAEIGGKPERHLFDQARALIPGAKRVAMVGDRLASDIEGGRRAGMETILVLSAAATRAEAGEANPEPDFVIDDLAALLR